ncbi:WecB/TagA/CpsF family glycosyltransferase [Eubacterium sp. MSJ-33]|uniref:WecB/TagA/CpsF family glycosyltransferase n=1 Tax=Eubacterium sp. MSJ-33 TaxID=2841528 RepID=UPI001C741409|nr:WecB/TagA/CpsF family glycosyltransferase [Eubacterium sp. MSJ-33]QWT52113.1 WecB/TagA/CpsF family glycosyltransferase [Eubacterium sp. MSJ-33]
MGRIRLLNTEIDNISMEEALDRIDTMAQEKKPSYVVTPNLDHIVTIERDAYFREAYAHADLILADGKPLLWIAKAKKTPIREKISGSDLFPRIAQHAANKGYTMFFLGAGEGVAQKAAEELKKKYPSLMVIGCYAPPMGFEHDREAVLQIINRVKTAKPDILVVGLGTPKQEKFLYRHYKQMGVPVSLGLGASFDFIAGNRKRAPRWMSNHGLEWLYRTLQEPKRLAGRYIKDAVGILPILFKYRNKGHYEDIR